MPFFEKFGDVSSRAKRLPMLFWLTVIAPTAVAILYYGLFASDVYISESRFVVRSPDKPASTGLGFLIKSTGFSNSGDEIYATKDYLNSRDALKAINRNGAFEKAFADPKIYMFDRYNGLGTDGTFEELFKYYNKKIKVEYDSSTSITTLTVRAYDANAARQFNTQLLQMAEETVNRMSERGREDLIKVAQSEVNAAKQQTQASSVALAQYRNRVGLIDPEKQATVQMQMISKLQDELIATKTRLLEVRTVATRSPQIPVLEARVNGLTREIDDQLGKVAGSRGSLAASAVRYQELALESQFAEKQLASALASLEEARSESRRKRAYVERVVEPNTPDYPLEPRRLRGIFSVLALGFVAWGILTMLIAGIREHRD